MLPRARAGGGRTAGWPDCRVAGGRWPDDRRRVVRGRTWTARCGTGKDRQKRISAKPGREIRDIGRSTPAAGYLTPSRKITKAVSVAPGIWSGPRTPEHRRKFNVWLHVRARIGLDFAVRRSWSRPRRTSVVAFGWCLRRCIKFTRIGRNCPAPLTGTAGYADRNRRYARDSPAVRYCARTLCQESCSRRSWRFL